MPRVLVAESDPHVRHFLIAVLAAGGHEVVEAAGGAQALTAVASERPDVAVTELRLPGLTGAGLVRAALRADPALPCLVLAGLGEREALDEALLAGAVAVILKPTTPVQVLCCVERALERRRLQVRDWGPELRGAAVRFARFAGR
ncbi:MAG TPA: response regulator [Candidatus Dormibacteraeota bacterium]|jgi:CheY-like chemotaxis protein|nr:response regulator [Candidatus Dormibacteraeota bacterium]